MPPNSPDARIALAFQHLKAGRLPAAERLSRELAGQRPGDARARTLLARVLNLSGRADEARDQVAAALALDPAFPPALIEQAQLARASGEHELAVIALERLTSQQPANPTLGYDLAVSLLELDRVDAAERELWRVLTLAPNLIDVRFKLGLVAVRRGDSRGALEQFRTCCEARPGWIEAWLNRGAMLLNLQQPRAAADAYGKALELDFDNAQALAGYASAERELGGGMERIIQVRLRVTERSPDSALAWQQLAEAYSSNDQLPEHAEAAERALALDPAFLTARFALFQEPPALVYQDRAAQERFVERWRDGLEFFERVDLGEPAHRAHLPLTLARRTNFHLHYMGEPYVDLQRRYAAVIARLAHVLVSPASAAEVPRQARDPARLRVGVVSPYMRRHTVSKLFRSLVEGLPRSRFSIELFHCGEREDEVTALWRAASDHYEFGNPLPHEWVRRIAARGLDALLFLDIGMHPTPQVLAAYRLAPLQCMLWGHPVTSGSSEMDLFLSSDAMEPEDGQAHYCERLVRLPRLGISYPAPRTEPDPAFRSPWSDEPDVVHFFLGQTVFKLTPEHDEVLARIAEQLPQARFTLLPHWREHVRLTLERRMRAAFEARGLAFERQVRLLPFLKESEFLALVQDVDVNLDSLGWSGGNSTLEITWFDVPTVTLPRALMRSRHSAAMMTLMGLDELIAKDVDDYVAIAIALGRDAERRAELRARIAARKHVLYDDAGAVAAFADVLEAGVRERA